MTTCAKCGKPTKMWHGPTGVLTWDATCTDAQVDACALRVELRDVKAERDAAVVQVAEWCASAEDHRLLTAERDDYYGDLSLLRAAVLAVAAEMTHEDRHVRHSTWAARLREACKEKS